MAPPCSTPWAATPCPTTPTTSWPPGSPPSARAPNNRSNERNPHMSATRSNVRDGQLAHASRTSITQYLAGVSAVHPWRVVAPWGLILAASVVAIGTLLGSVVTSDG